MGDKQQWIGTAISVGILLLVLTLRMRKMRKAQPLKVERLWIMPAFFTAVVAALYYVHPPHGTLWLYAALALCIGAGLGWFRGKLMHLTVDPETHEVCQQGSMAAMLFILVLVALRYGARSLSGQMAGDDPRVVVAFTDVMLAFGLGFVAAQRLEIGMRAKELIAAAKNGIGGKAK